MRFAYLTHSNHPTPSPSAPLYQLGHSIFGSFIYGRSQRFYVNGSSWRRYLWCGLFAEFQLRNVQYGINTKQFIRVVLVLLVLLPILFVVWTCILNMGRVENVYAEDFNTFVCSIALVLVLTSIVFSSILLMGDLRLQAIAEDDRIHGNGDDIKFSCLHFLFSSHDLSHDGQY